MRLPKGRGATILLAITAAALAFTAAVAFGVLPADDDVPGVPIPASPVYGSLEDSTAVGPGDVPLWDQDDVYAVSLGRNERIDATLTPAPDANFDLYLFSYLTRSVTHAFGTPSLIRAWSDDYRDGAVEKLSFVSDRSSVETYYLDVAAMYYAEGPYELEWSKTQLPTPSLMVTAPALTNGYGAAATVSGVATVTVGGVDRPMSGFTVYIMAMPAGSSTWTKVATTKTTTEGAFAATVRPTKTTKYYAKTSWAYSKEDSAPIGYGASTAVTVTPKAYLAFTSTPRGAYAGKSFAVSGVIKPSHGSTSRHIKLWVYRHNGTRYVQYRYYWMRGSGTSWAGKLSLPKGRYRFSLVCPADSLHASTYGTAFRYLTVK